MYVQIRLGKLIVVYLSTGAGGVIGNSPDAQSGGPGFDSTRWLWQLPTQHPSASVIVLPTARVCWVFAQPEWDFEWVWRVPVEDSRRFLVRKRNSSPFDASESCYTFHCIPECTLLFWLIDVDRWVGEWVSKTRTHSCYSTDVYNILMLKF